LRVSPKFAWWYSHTERFLYWFTLNVTMFKAHHLEIIHQYVSYCVKKKDVSPTKFHHSTHPYSRKQSTFELLKKAEENLVIFSPRLLCLPDISVSFVEYSRIPLLDLYKEKKNDPNVTYVMALTGAYSLIYFSYGKRTLKYTKCTMSSFPGISFTEIDPTKHKKGKLEDMPKPENWDKLHWGVYKERKDPKRSSVEVGKILGVSYQTVLTRFREILKTCQIWMPFFPSGYPNYAKYIISLKTDYEIGLIEELEKLDRSSYVYKTNDTLILTIFFDRHLEIDSFLKLEKKGVIHDMRVSFPVDSSNIFYEKW